MTEEPATRKHVGSKKESLSRELRKRLPGTVGNLIKLALALLLIRFVVPAIKPLDLILRELGLISLRQILDVVAFLVIIYYGYFILRDVKVLAERFVDFVILRFGIKEEQAPLRRAALDIVWLMGIILAYAAIVPVVERLLGIPWILMAVTLTIVVLALVFLYDCVRMLRLVFGVRIRRFIEVLADTVERAEREVEEERRREAADLEGEE